MQQRRGRLTAHQVVAPRPTVIEMRGEHCRLAFSLLLEQPGISILCPTHERQEAIVLCGPRRSAPAAENPSEIIRRHAKGGVPSPLFDQGEWHSSQPNLDAKLTELVQKEGDPQ